MECHHLRGPSCTTTRKRNQKGNVRGTGSRSPSVYESIVVSVVCFQVAPSAIQRCPKHTVIIRRRLTFTFFSRPRCGSLSLSPLSSAFTHTCTAQTATCSFATDLAGLMHPARAPITRWAQWHASHTSHSFSNIEQRGDARDLRPVEFILTSNSALTGVSRTK